MSPTLGVYRRRREVILLLAGTTLASSTIVCAPLLELLPALIGCPPRRAKLVLLFCVASASTSAYPRLQEWCRAAASDEKGQILKSRLSKLDVHLYSFSLANCRVEARVPLGRG
jgi:hypothetical protein